MRARQSQQDQEREASAGDQLKQLDQETVHLMFAEVHQKHDSASVNTLTRLSRGFTRRQVANRQNSPQCIDKEAFNELLVMNH